MATTAEPIEQIKARVNLIPTDAAREEIEAGDSLLLDIREQHEWDEAHLAEAEHVPQGELLERMDELAPDTSQRVLLYCRTDSRSSRAADALQSLGYESVAVMENGIVGWLDAEFPVVAKHALTKDQRMRYSRHTLLEEFGAEGQVKLLNAKVLLLGAGGLGASSALYLAAAGVGTLGIVDDDVVDESNLQRQVLHNMERLGMPKVESARQTLQLLNPDVKVIAHQTRLTSENILEILAGYD